jgi:hypothetical protein
MELKGDYLEFDIWYLVFGIWSKAVIILIKE